MDMSTLCMRYQIVRLGRRFVFGLLMVVAVSACAVLSGRTSNITHEGNANLKTENAGTTTADLEFFITVENQQWKMGDPIPVKLRVRNAGKVPIVGICSFDLIDPTAGSDPFKQGRNLWAPVVIQASGVRPARAAPGETASSMLDPGQAIEYEVDLNKLSWGTAIQASWPDGPFSQSAEPGKYELSFSMKVRTVETPGNVESNKVKVSLK